ncbi:MAG: Alpha/beta hydrolase family protein [Methanosaeta sp. PtaU1.Bin112]|nr:MAG: Alpha/beta hydrolase family protein [Methanosaeta sp. PtaU1.Bin112]
MINPRRYGCSPFSVAVIHGGPGAAGEMAPVALRLSARRGVLEPMQTARSLPAQVEELKELLEEWADLPVTLIGFSWGAWLSFILAACHPDMVRKLILVASGPFQERYAPEIMRTRLCRLDERERGRVELICSILKRPKGCDREKDRLLAELGELLSRADAFDPIKLPEEEEKEKEKESDSSKASCRADIFASVWKEASLLRQSGKLLENGKRIVCPVTAIHGDWDPHPHKGVSEPLRETLKSFKFILLESCGHKPWIERRAEDRFYSVLEEEMLDGESDCQSTADRQASKPARR